MREAADELEFERAARLRDRLVSVRKAIEKQQMVADRAEDLDVIGLADDELEAAVQVFYVRRGRVVGRKGFVLDKVEDLTPERADGQRARGPLLRPTAARPAQAGAGAGGAGRPDLYERWLTDVRGTQRRHPGAAARRQADAAGDGHPQRRARSSPATGCGGPPTTTAGPGP